MAGSPYADLHVNDVGLLVMISGPETWSVRKIAQSLGAPISTISFSTRPTRATRFDQARTVAWRSTFGPDIGLTPAGDRLR